ncbi:hypothetical protein TYRP_023716, partial [Tyrophagus putrescentiae]
QKYAELAFAIVNAINAPPKEEEVEVMEVSNGEDNGDGSSSDSSDDNDDPTPSRPVQIMEVDYINDSENDPDFEREDKEGDEKGDEEGDEEEDEEEEGDEENVEIDEDGEEDEEEVIIIEDDDADVQIVEPKFAGKYTDLPPLPKPDWNKEPPHWKLSVMAESVRKWQKWQNDITTKLRNCVIRKDRKNNDPQTPEVFSGLENVCALVVAMQQAKYKQDKRNKVTAYCSKCDLHYPDRSFASHIPLCNAASDTNYPRMQRHIGKLALVHYDNTVTFSNVIYHAQLVCGSETAGAYGCTVCKRLSFKTEGAAKTHKRICQKISSETRVALSSLVEHIVKEFKLNIEIPTEATTGYFAKTAKTAELRLLQLDPDQDDGRLFTKLQYKSTKEEKKGTRISQYIDAKLPLSIWTLYPRALRNQAVFRRGEYATTKLKTQLCPYCSLYYQQLYISAHIMLCRANKLPESDPYSRVGLYNAARTRFVRLSDAEQKYGVDDTAEIQVYKSPDGKLKINCNCPTPKSDRIEKWEEHARCHRYEFPFKSAQELRQSHSQCPQFFWSPLNPRLPPQCFQLTTFQQCFSSPAFGCASISRTFHCASPPLTLLPLLLWLPDDATLFTVSAVTGCIECGRSPKTPCSSAGSMVLPSSQPAHRPPPGPLALPGSPQHRKKPSAALAAADQQVDKSSSKNSCIASSSVTGRSWFPRPPPAPVRPPSVEKRQRSVPGPWEFTATTTSPPARREAWSSLKT